jgi:hypothetical protein
MAKELAALEAWNHILLHRRENATWMSRLEGHGPYDGVARWRDAEKPFPQRLFGLACALSVLGTVDLFLWPFGRSICPE